MGVRPVLVFARELHPEIHSRLRACGAEIEAIDYSKGAAHYCRRLRVLVERLSIDTAHIVFFDYFSALPWIARLTGIAQVIYEMQNSGEFLATSWKRQLLRMRTRLATKPITRVIAISRFAKQQLVSAGVAEDRITVRYLGVDTERFKPEPAVRQEWRSRFLIQPEELVLSSVSYLRPFKNPHVLVEACSELAKRSVPFRLFVAGDGEILPALKALCEERGVSHRVHWLGNVSDPKTLMQASDIFLLASVGEAFGLVLAEAMACGVPIVGSRSGSLPEVVDDQRTGLLCTTLDALSFADSIERLARDPELRHEMGLRAVERVRANFTVDLAVERTIRMYEAMWGERCDSRDREPPLGQPRAGAAGCTK